MSKPAFVIARNHLRLLFREPSVIIILFVIPIVVMTLSRPLAHLALSSQGLKNTNGAEQVVPGITIMFSSYIVGVVGYGIFEEHGWGTWERLRSNASAIDIISGKVAAPFILVLLQGAFLFAFGRLAFGFTISGNLGDLLLIEVCYGLTMVVLGTAVAGIARTAQQIGAINNMVLILFGFIGGAFFPASVLPGWTQALGPFVPTYWAMQPLLRISIGPRVGRPVFECLGVLVAFAAAFIVIALRRFKLDATKIWG
jgi:ABC-2 type transport system permease protein